LSGFGPSLRFKEEDDSYQEILKNVKKSVHDGESKIYNNGPNYTQHGFMLGVPSKHTSASPDQNKSNPDTTPKLDTTLDLSNPTLKNL
jgi:hypothetical protein